VSLQNDHSGENENTIITLTEITIIRHENALLPTKVLLQLGLDGRTIISSAYPSFGFGGRNSTGH